GAGPARKEPALEVAAVCGDLDSLLAAVDEERPDVGPHGHPDAARQYRRGIQAADEGAGAARRSTRDVPRARHGFLRGERLGACAGRDRLDAIVQTLERRVRERVVEDVERVLWVRAQLE